MGNYRDNEPIFEVVALLKEYVDLFSQNLTYMKGIKRALGEMWIEVKLNAQPIRKWPPYTETNNK
jgi:hypothetical protein